jgi:hypothetical protein
MKRTYARRRLPQHVQDSPQSSEDEATKLTPKRARASDQGLENSSHEQISRFSGPAGALKPVASRSTPTASHSLTSKGLVTDTRYCFIVSHGFQNFHPYLLVSLNQTDNKS